MGNETSIGIDSGSDLTRLWMLSHLLRYQPGNNNLRMTVQEFEALPGPRRLVE